MFECHVVSPLLAAPVLKDDSLCLNIYKVIKDLLCAVMSIERINATPDLYTLKGIDPNAANKSVTELSQ